MKIHRLNVTGACKHAALVKSAGCITQNKMLERSCKIRIATNQISASRTLLPYYIEDSILFIMPVPSSLTISI